MSVYVDDAENRYGRMVMCHMVADTEAELHEMAQNVGVRRRWYQHGHYDVCKQMRAAAVERGAKEISQREAARLRRALVNAHAGRSEAQ